MIRQIESVVKQGICSSPQARPPSEIYDLSGLSDGQSIVASLGFHPTAKVGTPMAGEFPPAS
jgi:hypothetical protein